MLPLLAAPLALWATAPWRSAAYEFRSRPALLSVAAAPADLRSWLSEEANVSPQFLDAVLSVCDDEMIGSVENLRTLSTAGMLATVFKPVIAASIEAALAGSGGGGGGGGGAGAAAGAALDGGASSLPLREVRRRLMAQGMSTWGNEAELRRLHSMFAVQDTVSVAPVEAPAWPPTLTAGGAVAKPTSASAAAPPAAPPPAAVAPAAAPAEAAAPPATAADKSTYTVKLLNPDGEQVVEYDPSGGDFLLDYLDELDNADDYADLPYACRAGSCSACAGKLVSGTMDTSACGFLSEEQKAAGWVLTCTAKPTSDCVIETHKEDDMY